MSGSINKVILVGNVGQDPEVRRMQSGDAVVSFSVATSETWRDKNSGERREKTEWHKVVIFNEGLAKVAEAYVRKGSKVYIEGALQTRSWDDQSGVKKYATEIVLQKFRGEMQLLDKPDGERSPEPSKAKPAPSYGQASGSFDRNTGQVMDDEIPF